MFSRAPFFGRGIGFPFRLNPATGGMQMTEGSADSVSVALEYAPDRHSIREDPLRDRRNHIAEAIAHILLVHPGEHDTLPEFGSRLFTLINKPNNFETHAELETWLEVATKRWEKRAEIPIPEGCQWHGTDHDTDENIAPVRFLVQFIRDQVEGNLISPFVTPRQARAQEYPLGEADTAGHDWTSRYHGQPVYRNGDIRYLRLRRRRPLPPAKDDVFYEVKYGDSWMRISYRVYGDNRFWWIIAERAISDAAAAGESSNRMNPCSDPKPGTLLRIPSRSRLLMEITA